MKSPVFILTNGSHTVGVFASFDKARKEKENLNDKRAEISEWIPE